MRILIVTGIYPPEVGGPARYAAELSSIWSKDDRVEVAVASRWNRFPPGIRHVLFFLSIIPKVMRADAVLVLDTFSAAFPAASACVILGTPFALRAGGDFAWEAYVGRVRRDVTIRSFYADPPRDLTAADRVRLSIVRWVFRRAAEVVFTVPWYRDIAAPAYGIPRASIVENPDGPRRASPDPTGKSFLSAGRPIFLKNIVRLRRAFTKAERESPGISLIEGSFGAAEYEARLSEAYAVVIPSLSDISPNTAMDAIRFGRPLVLTRECGYAERLASAAELVDPLDEEDIAAAIARLSDPAVYAVRRAAALSMRCDRGMDAVAAELRAILAKICASSS